MKVYSIFLFVILIVAAQAIDYHHGYNHDVHEEHGPVAYEFHYGVHDAHTGDIKSQKEIRKDDQVEGSYDLIDSDGHRRVVHYRADDHSGFEAVVHREPVNIKIPVPEHHHHDYYHEPQHHHANIIAHVAPIVHHGHGAEIHHGHY